jgi:hypothetical protein
MNLMSQISKGLLRAGRKFSYWGQKTRERHCPGKITVNGKEITDLVPLGGYRQLGITKAGRVSFSGLSEGLKVKVYSSYSTDHSKLRERLESTNLGQRFFPRLVMSDKNHMVEEWIEGLPVEKLDGALLERASGEIKSFLSECQNSKELVQIAEQNLGAFCYFQDYLIKRIEPWCVLDFVRKFKISWQEKYETVKNKIKVRLSHPDLSARNIMLESKSGRFVVIDNELVGIGHGWILDRRNSLLKNFTEEAENFTYAGIEKGFVHESWKLRLIGSALDASNFDRAYMLAVNPDS